MLKTSAHAMCHKCCALEQRGNCHRYPCSVCGWLDNSHGIAISRNADGTTSALPSPHCGRCKRSTPAYPCFKPDQDAAIEACGGTSILGTHRSACGREFSILGKHVYPKIGTFSDWEDANVGGKEAAKRASTHSTSVPITTFNGPYFPGLQVASRNTAHKASSPVPQRAPEGSDGGAKNLSSWEDNASSDSDNGEQKAEDEQRGTLLPPRGGK